MIIIDTGPLVAALRKGDHYHAWALGQFEALPLPFMTCEAVLTETAYLLQRAGNSPGAVLRLVRSGALLVDCLMASEAVAIEQLLERYQNVPMDFADACLVRLSERNPSSTILTIDSDFNIYRKHRKETIDVIMPL